MSARFRALESGLCENKGESPAYGKEACTTSQTGGMSRSSEYPLARGRRISGAQQRIERRAAGDQLTVVADVYIELQREAKRENARAAAKTLAPLVAERSQRVSLADDAAEAFRVKSGLLVGW